MTVDSSTLVAYSLSVALFIFCLFLFGKVNVLNKRYDAFMADGNGASLETVLNALNSEVRDVRKEISDNRKHIKEISDILGTTVRGIGVVRFNAFQDTGSDLSFAVALLDADKSGVVVSSIYGREESRTYAKPVLKGQSAYQLSGEELEAIKKAEAAVRPLSR